MVRSAVATRYHEGFDFHAGSDTAPFRAAPFVGAWVANKRVFSAPVRSWAKSSHTPASVRVIKPSGSGRISPPNAVAGREALSELADSPASGAKAAMYTRPRTLA